MTRRRAWAPGSSDSWVLLSSNSGHSTPRGGSTPTDYTWNQSYTGGGNTAGTYMYNCGDGTLLGGGKGKPGAELHLLKRAATYALSPRLARSALRQRWPPPQQHHSDPAHLGPQSTGRPHGRRRRLQRRPRNWSYAGAMTVLMNAIVGPPPKLIATAAASITSSWSRRPPRVSACARPRSCRTAI